ncbi:hypothetical protein KIH74_31205 [Kineosporia sp. J2-2]|uniref:Extracellular repeat, HAF family n=1 Tax=Kineosporia corallincola TaxID=2835133 RepID=A0ABS5TRN0_9ACTN|nr:hypothetical protein [Kineosporia corallincola]MBT0773456.1 hypothetical protein [Kineosporia corallincola]
MRSASTSARLATVALAAGLIVAPAATASAASSCTWNVHTPDVPAGYVTFNTFGAGGDYFVGNGRDQQWNTVPVLWHGDDATVLDTPGTQGGDAYDVNADGLVVAFDREQQRPYLWQDGTVTPLAVPDGAVDPVALSINSSGTIVGSALVGGVSHGIVWSADSPGTYQDLGTGQGWLTLGDVNDDGVIVGTTRPDELGPGTALKGTAEEGLSPLFDRDDLNESNAGQIAGPYVTGSVTFTEGYRIAQYVWKDGELTETPPGFRAAQVNSDGLVAGNQSVDAAGPGFLGAGVWQNGALSPLPLPSTGGVGVRLVTDTGLIIGTSPTADPDTDDGRPVPVTWTCD